MTSPLLLAFLLALDQEPGKTSPTKRMAGNVAAPASPGLDNPHKFTPPAIGQNPFLPPDIDLRVVELQALVSHYQRLCDTLLELEFEHEMSVIETGADHPEKNRGIQRLETLRRRKSEVGKKIEAIRAEIRGPENRKAPGGKP